MVLRWVIKICVVRNNKTRGVLIAYREDYQPMGLSLNVTVFQSSLRLVGLIKTGRISPIFRGQKSLLKGLADTVKGHNLEAFFAEAERNSYGLLPVFLLALS